jgi:transcriptional regulator with XRE-family HTH domain
VSDNPLAMADWYVLLRAARRDLGLSPANLAVRAGISEASVRAYEMGRRHPTRERLAALLTCLRIDRRSRNDMFISAGFAPEAIDEPEGSLTRNEAAHLANERPWPAFVVNELMEMIAANRAALRLTGMRRAVLDDRVERNVMVLAARVVSAAPTEQTGDWGVAASRAIARMKAAGIGSPERRDKYFEALLDRMAAGDPGLARQFMVLWESTPAERPVSVSWSYPARFTLPSGETLQLHCVATRVNTRDGTEVHDWIPANLASYALLDGVIAARRGR